jgi:hypothetical protein
MTDLPDPKSVTPLTVRVLTDFLQLYEVRADASVVVLLDPPAVCAPVRVWKVLMLEGFADRLCFGTDNNHNTPPWTVSRLRDALQGEDADAVLVTTITFDGRCQPLVDCGWTDGRVSGGRSLLILSPFPNPKEDDQ